MPTSADGTDNSAQAISEKGIMLPATLSKTSLGHQAAPKDHGLPLHRQTHHMTAAPIHRRHQTINVGCNESNATAIRAKANPQTRTR